ncbi:MAG: glutamate-5-semialdehyde dehydrogenase [candidate division KSB1 bacterium]|nr:glutamate-5-semialdehyde dehydrogenase [candidate division KSB1 bacterium]
MTKNLNSDLRELAAACRAAAKITAQWTTVQKNRLLNSMAEALVNNKDEILAANAKDVEAARLNGLSDALIDRLLLNAERLQGMADAVREIAALPDPVGEIIKTWRRPNGLQVSYMRIPLGVIAIIYEARPNVTSDAAALCLKSGNAVILRGGSEAFHSNQAIVGALHQVLRSFGEPTAAITFIPTTEREAIKELLTFTDEIDLVIPRGGEGLIRFVAEHSRIPVIKHYKGVCHQFVDYNADIDMAIDLLVDGKCSRPAVCNALETLLVHEQIAEAFLPKAAEVMRRKGVELRGCEKARRIVSDMKPADEEDYAAEYLALILAVRIVSGLEEAIEHIQRYGSDHTEVIVTNDYAHAKEFLRRVNSSVVLVNASSRFSDGGQLGLGAEIGISTTKLHAFGPMGLEALTTQKFIVHGDGQTRHGLSWE